ncbi:MAG: GNAT family N-acetyltransferase [Anaerolineae bacterium]|nr:GNAT family N-acetyltransferase [Gloeobacterales cyanobacterium ES-bin-313]
MTLSTRKEDLLAIEIQDLFDAGAFWAQGRRIEDIELMIQMSNPVVSARIDNRLVGFTRATGDGVYRAVIWDVVVDPACQGQGIGRQLVEALISHPLMCAVERVYLMTTFQQGFYEKLGFVKNASTTMVLTRNT